VRRRLAQEVDGVGELVARPERPPVLDGAGEHEQADEDEVDQRRGGLVEVVVVRGDELAELVDEEAEADAADHGRRAADAAAEKGEQQAGPIAMSMNRPPQSRWAMCRPWPPSWG
jgi:hypothetical protein